MSSSADDLTLNNPAMTRPAVQNREPHQISSNEQPKWIKVSTPAGHEELVPASTKSNNSNGLAEWPSKYERGWRRIVRNFSPSWFSVTMGTGIVATLFFAIPFHATWLYNISIIVFVLNVVLFSVAMVVSVLRYTLYPAIWGVMIRDPTNSLFLGTVPMGFATLIEMWVFVCVPAWESEWVKWFPWICWMIDSIVAAAVTLALIFTLISREGHEALDRITAVQLLPIAATIVAAGTGAEVAEILTDPNHALGTIITCYVMWGMSVPFAVKVLTIYYERLAVHKLPPREIVVSCFLPLGPLSFGGYTIMYLGKVARRIFPQTGTLHPLAGDVVYIMGFAVALIMWAWAVVWLILALASIYKSRPFPFNMGWWGFVFPLGVFSASAIQIGIEMPSMFFKVVGTIVAVAVILLWIVVTIGTARGAWSGKLFYAPCLKDLKRADKVPEEQDTEKAQ